MSHTALILGDQLMRENPALEGAGRVLLVESAAILGRGPLHRRRAHLVLSGMRHLAADLRERGLEVAEHREAPSLAAALREERGEVVCAEPTRAGAGAALTRLGVRVIPSSQFLTAPEDFAHWAEGRRRITMEPFYREQRARFGVLLDERGDPEGGRWNFDAENRRPPAKGLHAPAPWRPPEDAIDAQVRADLDRLAPALDLWGEDGPRRFAVTPTEAPAALDDFVAHRLPEFGPWQDAMVHGEPFLFHALLSVPLNLGVLAPLDAVRAAEAAYRAGEVPLASAEGFIRQVLGWREYVWGMYRLRAEQWPSDDALGADLPLPAGYWGAETGWACFDDTVARVREEGYAHHIERLMVLGNAGLLVGVRPWELVRWFERAFVDGAEWVMAPNAAGMALFADGGTMMTKPYAAGGNYIRRMSGGSHCRACRYDPGKRTGDEACPFTALYWDFVDRHRERLAASPRTAMPVRTLARFDAGELDAIRARAREARAELDGRAA